MIDDLKKLGGWILLLATALAWGAYLMNPTKANLRRALGH